MSGAALAVGATVLWRWEAPAPVAAGTTPALVVRRGADAVAGVPALAAAVDPVSITAIGDDRRTLTVAAGLTDGEAAMAAGPEWGAAWIVAPGGGAFPVRVSGVTPSSGGAATVRIADPLPRAVVVGGASIQWASWYATLGPDDVTATASRALTWTVTYRPIHAGAAAGEETERRSSGRLAVVARPFATGLTVDEFARQFPGLGQTVAARDNGRSGILDAAERELLLHLLPAARGRGLYVDDLDGEAFQLTHAHLAAAMVVEATDPDRAVALRERAAVLRDLALRAVWADADSDGTIGPGEDGAPLSGPPRLSSSVRRRGGGRAPAFTRDMSH